MPLYHSSASLLGLGCALAAGCTLALGKRFRRRAFWTECRDSKATVIQYVGETCRYLLAAPASPLDTQHRVRMAFGNGLRPDVWPRFKRRFNIDTVFEFYAATEGPGALFNRSRNAFSQGAVGLNGPLLSALIGASAVIIRVDPSDHQTPLRDPTTHLCQCASLNEPGELLYKLNAEDLDTHFQGYYRDPVATSRKILRDVLTRDDAYFATGDVVCRDSEGRWFFRDRASDGFRWKSENVSAQDVTAALCRVTVNGKPALEEASVYGVRVPGHDGRAGCAAVLLAPGEQGSHESKALTEVLTALSIGVRSHLPRYAVPVFLRVLTRRGALMRRTGTNKQQKHALREEGVDPGRVSAESESGDAVYWLPAGAQTYRLFTGRDWRGLMEGEVIL
jgi:acyl-CoA synthetase (AMP-forming)/AMP-acid ligase II